MSEWQPIETAPKDGTAFLAYEGGKSHPHYECWWQHNDWTDEQYWQDEADSEPEPTHWMSLPAPPATP